MPYVFRRNPLGLYLVFPCLASLSPSLSPASLPSIGAHSIPQHSPRFLLASFPHLWWRGWGGSSNFNHLPSLSFSLFLSSSSLFLYLSLSLSPPPLLQFYPPTLHGMIISRKKERKKEKEKEKDKRERAEKEKDKKRILTPKTAFQQEEEEDRQTDDRSRRDRQTD